MAPKRKSKNNGVNNGEMVAQEHGGALNPGGTPGNKGGTGRPPNELRGTLREILERGLPVLEGYIEGRVPVKMVGRCEECGHEHEDYKLLPTDMILLQTVKATDRLKALEMAAKYGGVAELSLTVDELPEEADTPERAARLWEMLQRIKNVAELEKVMVDHAKKQVGVATLGRHEAVRGA